MTKTYEATASSLDHDQVSLGRAAKLAPREIQAMAYIDNITLFDEYVSQERISRFKVNVNELGQILVTATVTTD